MYAKNCGYSSENRLSLPWQLSEEADCGAVCAITSTCAYFTFAKGTCYLYALTNPSSNVVPSPSNNTSFSSCGYVTSKKTPSPIWKEIKNTGPLNLTVTTASNCGYIGTDPNDIGTQSNFAVSLSESDCRISCASVPICTQYRWANGTCQLMQLVKPVTYYSVSGSCGNVNNRQTVSFTSGSNGMVMYATYCDYTKDNRKILATVNAGAYAGKNIQPNLYEDDCGTFCAYTPSCSYFAYIHGYCNLYAIANTSLPVPTPYTTTYYSSCGYVVSSKVPAIKWQSTSSGQIMSAQNCNYIGLDPADLQIQSQNVQGLGEADCSSICAITSTCSYYRWARSGWCRLMSIIKPVAFYSESGSCGYVVTRPTFNFISGSNGLAMYAPKCGYTSDNRIFLQWQKGDEADCGAICALNSTCSYFAYVGSTCNMYSIANQSLALTPSPFTSGYYSSCGYVTSHAPFVPNWQSDLSAGNLTWAPNCGYIGTDPADIGVQGINAYWWRISNEQDCRSRCISTPTCSYYKFSIVGSTKICYIMPIVKPVVYYSETGSCGFVVSRPNLNFTSGSIGLAMYAQSCGFTNDNGKTLISQRCDEADCGAVCSQTPTCSFFAFSKGNCNMYTKADQSSSVVPLPYYTTLFSSCGYVTGQTAPTLNWQSDLSSGNLTWAPNCGYIGTDPADIGVQGINAYWWRISNEQDCRSRCISTPTCSYYKFSIVGSEKICYIMPIVKPVVYYSATGSCGYVVNRRPMTWTTYGQMQINSNCTFDYRAYVGLGLGNDLNACANKCSDDSKCKLFNLSGKWCNLISFTGEPLVIYSTSTACGKKIPVV